MTQQTKPTDSTSTPPATPSSNNGVIDTATLELRASWQRQDATANPDELRAAEEELAEFKKAMNENRTLSGQPVLYP
jgi:hypothetical protein